MAIPQKGQLQDRYEDSSPESKAEHSLHHIALSAQSPYVARSQQEPMAKPAPGETSGLGPRGLQHWGSPAAARSLPRAAGRFQLLLRLDEQNAMCTKRLVSMHCVASATASSVLTDAYSQLFGASHTHKTTASNAAYNGIGVLGPASPLLNRPMLPKRSDETPAPARGGGVTLVIFSEGPRHMAVNLSPRCHLKPEPINQDNFWLSPSLTKNKLHHTPDFDVPRRSGTHKNCPRLAKVC